MNKLNYFSVLLTGVICVNALGTQAQLESEPHQSNATLSNNQTQSYIAANHNSHKLQYLKHYRNLITSKIEQSTKKLPLYIYKQAKADTKDVVNNRCSKQYG